MLARAREKGLDPVDLAELGRSSGEDAYVVAAGFMQRYLVVLDDMSAVDYADLIRRAVGIAENNRDELRTRYSHVFVDEYQDTDPSQVAPPAGPGRRRTQPRGRRRPRPVDLRLPRGRRQRHPPLPARPSRTSDGAPAPGGRAAYDAPLRLTAADGVPGRGRLHRPPRRHRPRRLGGVPVTDGGTGRGGPRLGRRHDLRHRPGRDRAPRRPAPSGAPRARRPLVRDGRAGAVGTLHAAGAAPVALRRRGAGRGRQRRHARWSANRP